jgi:hypothetical protein
MNMNVFKIFAKKILSTSQKDKVVPGKINLDDSIEGFYGTHRSGWLYALESIKSLHNENGVLFDSFIERNFNWNPKGVRPHEEPWIGVIHVPPNIPAWFKGGQANDRIFATAAWQKSAPHCRGLFALSEYHKKSLEKKLEIPVNTLTFATETPELKWSWDRFQYNKEKKVVQVGWWQRKLHTIFQLPVKKYKKLFIKITYADVDGVMAIERDILKKQGLFSDEMYDTASVVTFLPDHEYDCLLSENIVIANLYDTSANNLICECIVRNTPILVNPLEAVIEYLGQGYPFYFNSLEEAVQKAEDLDLIYKTHQYLINHPVKGKLTGEYFRESFINSEIYKNL